MDTDLDKRISTSNGDGIYVTDEEIEEMLMELESDG